MTHNALPNIDVLHAVVPGRVRLRVGGLYKNKSFKLQLERCVSRTPVITFAKANLRTGTMLILYDNKCDLAEVIGAISDFLCVTANLNECSRKYAGGEKPDLHAHDETSIFEVSGAMRRDWHRMPTSEVLSRFGTSIGNGLAREAAAKKLAKYGRNCLEDPQKRSGFDAALEQFQNLPVALLGVSAVISVMTGGLVDAAVIGGVVLINAAIGYFTERQAEKTISALDTISPSSARVIREGAPVEIDPAEVVPGDIMVLAHGSFISADARLIKTHHLSLDESALTGESLPVNKSADFIGTEHTPLADRRNMAYRGTSVAGGSGLCLVVATGGHTELGQIQAMTGGAAPPPTPMQKQLDELGRQLAIMSGAICAGFFVIGFLRGHNVMQMLKTSISLAVAAVPEGLPSVATTTLALGIRDMGKRKVAIRRLNAVETLGSVKTFCLDKTGTLTLNRMSVTVIQADTRRILLRDEKLREVDRKIEPVADAPLRRLLEVIALCNESEITGDTLSPVIRGTPTENALLEAALKSGIDVTELRHRLPRLKVRYRSEGSPYMRTVHKLTDQKKLVAVKGSPANLLTHCRWRQRNGELLPLDRDIRTTILERNEHMAGEEALRVLGVAYKECTMPDADMEDLIWLGLVGMADSLRDGMDKLVEQIHKAGIRTVMITGDQGPTAYAIGKQLNLSDGGALKILDSAALDKLDPALMSGLVRQTDVFARVSPAHKLRIVQALQHSREVVAMTGDGINDGPALKAADIGVAMGGGANDVARSVSDLVLEDDNLATLVAAIERGRTIYADIRKTIRFLLATNLSEIEVMLAGMLTGAGQPLNPMQLLWINLVTDIFPGLALSLEPPETDVMSEPPRDPDIPIISRRDLMGIGRESAVITAATLSTYFYALRRYGRRQQANTFAFTTLTLAQLLYTLSCRSERRSIFHLHGHGSNPYLRTALLTSLAGQAVANFLPGVRRLLNTTRLGLSDAVVVGVGACAPLLINELLKLSKEHRS